MKQIKTSFGSLTYYQTPRNTFHACGFGIECSTVELLVAECEKRFHANKELEQVNYIPYAIGYAHACGYHD